jgi:hypothetical protein
VVGEERAPSREQKRRQQLRRRRDRPQPSHRPFRTNPSGSGSPGGGGIVEGDRREVRGEGVRESVCNHEAETEARRVPGPKAWRRMSHKRLPFNKKAPSAGGARGSRLAPSRASVHGPHRRQIGRTWQRAPT